MYRALQTTIPNNNCNKMRPENNFQVSYTSLGRIYVLPWDYVIRRVKTNFYYMKEVKTFRTYRNLSLQTFLRIRFQVGESPGFVIYVVYSKL